MSEHTSVSPKSFDADDNGEKSFGFLSTIEMGACGVSLDGLQGMLPPLDPKF